MSVTCTVLQMLLCCCPNEAVPCVLGEVLTKQLQGMASKLEKYTHALHVLSMRAFVKYGCLMGTPSKSGDKFWLMRKAYVGDVRVSMLEVMQMNVTVLNNVIEYSGLDGEEVNFAAEKGSASSALRECCEAIDEWYGKQLEEQELRCSESYVSLDRVNTGVSQLNRWHRFVTVSEWYDRCVSVSYKVLSG